MSFAPTVDYYFTNFAIKPFIGLGLGLYSDTYDYIAFGLRPKIGISFDQVFELTWEYNQIFSGSNSTTASIDNYYTNLKASASIGIIRRKIFKNIKKSKKEGTERPNLTPKKDGRLHFGFHYSTPDGIGLHLYPKWYYSQKLAFGLNLELVGVEGGRMIRGPFNNVETLSPEIVSLMPTVDYYLTNTLVRPFVGFGIGMYYSVLFKTERSISIGLKPKIGLSFNRIFELSIEYNRIFSNHITITAFNNHYLAFKASFGLGIIQSKRAKDK